MKKLIFIASAVAIIMFARSLLNRTESRVSLPKDPDASAKRSDKSTSMSQSVEITSRSIFVPYWNVENLDSLTGTYDRLIYFGISVNENGVNREDQGFTNIQTFIDETGGTPKLLAVRMLDTDANIAILEDSSASRTVIEDVALVAKEYGFDGIVLDLELSVIPFSNVKDQITTFTNDFGEEMESRSLYFAVALYGDTYFRGRPYDVEKIANRADEIFVMAYDFHKSRGEPGPNYPLGNSSLYGYDFKKMIKDFTADVPAEKMNVIFGMYGYNWTLGKQGKPLKAATAFSLNDAEGMFYPSCSYTSCTVVRDEESAEMKATYIDNEGYNRVAWFEDEESVRRKTEYLQGQGIGSITYWVHGYF